VLPSIEGRDYFFVVFLAPAAFLVVVVFFAPAFSWWLNPTFLR
jgi:hypothetical protein